MYAVSKPHPSPLRVLLVRRFQQFRYESVGWPFLVCEKKRLLLFTCSSVLSFTILPFCEDICTSIWLPRWLGAVLGRFFFGGRCLFFVAGVSPSHTHTQNRILSLGSSCIGSSQLEPRINSSSRQQKKGRIGDLCPCVFFPPFRAFEFIILLCGL